ncbi:unnamed protein product [Lasius platythorax]|uniref:Uncharacterized protein n=1 Tax=Lasius platythorax TaxID=488582 RepID=A0AAV2N378_9HYME
MTFSRLRARRSHVRVTCTQKLMPTGSGHGLIRPEVPDTSGEIRLRTGERTANGKNGNAESRNIGGLRL